MQMAHYKLTIIIIIIINQHPWLYKFIRTIKDKLCWRYRNFSLSSFFKLLF